MAPPIKPKTKQLPVVKSKPKQVPARAAPAKVATQTRATTRTERGLTLAYLLKKCPPLIRHESRDVVLKSYNPKRKTRGGAIACTSTTFSMNSRSGKTHKVTVVSLDKDAKKLSTASKVRVECDCENFMYYWEYALSTWGAAKIKFSNGEPATVTNPGNYPGVCKHVYKVLRTIYDRGD